MAQPITQIGFLTPGNFDTEAFDGIGLAAVLLDAVSQRTSRARIGSQRPFRLEDISMADMPWPGWSVAAE